MKKVKRRWSYVNICTTFIFFKPCRGTLMDLYSLPLLVGYDLKVVLGHLDCYGKNYEWVNYNDQSSCKELMCIMGFLC